MHATFCRIFYKFSISQVTQQRSQFFKKICFSKNKYLGTKVSPTKYLTTKLSRHGLALFAYRNTTKFYLNRVLKNVLKLSDNNEFKNLYMLYDSFKDFNRVIVWRVTQLNPLFNLKIIKGQRVNYYLPQNSRTHTVFF